MDPFNDGDFPGPQHGAIPVGNFPGFDDYEGPRGESRDFDDFDSDNRQYQNKNNKKNKNKDDKKPVEIKYEGYVFSKAEPSPGEQSTWSRVGKTCLPFDDKTLAKMAKSHRQKSRTTIHQDFMALSTKQRSIIDRVIAERKLNEANKNADWVLVDVQRVERKGWTTKETRSLRIIIKRQDKTQLPKELQKDTGKDKTKDGEKSGKDKSKSSQIGEIIDLSVPLKKKDNKNKNGDKKLKRSQSADNLDLFDDPVGLSIGPRFDHGPRGHNQPFPVNQQFPPNQFPGPIDVHGPPPGPGPMPMPFDHNGPGQFPPPPPNLPSARQSFPQNVFAPNPEFAIPGQFDSPLHEHDFPHPNHGPSARNRSQSRPRRSSTRPPAVDERRLNDLQDEVEELKFKMENWQFHSDSSEGTYEDEMWSPTGSRGPEYSPPSSPISQFSDAMPSGSLGRRSKSYGRDPRFNPQYRSQKYNDVDIQPAYSHGRRDSHHVPSRRRHSSRPKLTRAITMHDDYPSGGGMEPRFRPQRPMQRRLTYASNHDFDEYDDRRPREYRESRDYGRASSGPRSSAYYDRDYDGYERRRGEGFPERRRSVVIHPDDRY